MASVKFYLDNKSTKKADQNIFAQVTVGNGSKFKLYPGIRLKPADWDKDNQVATSQEITMELEDYKQMVLSNFRKCTRERGGQEPNRDEFREYMRQILKPETTPPLPPPPTCEYTIIDALKLRIQACTTEAPGTISMYNKTIKNLEAYAEEYNRSLLLTKLDYRFYSGFMQYLVNEADYINDTANNHLRKFQAAINFFVLKHDNLVSMETVMHLKHLEDKFIFFNTESNDRQHMELDEILRFYRTDLAEWEMSEVARDRYVFCCFTGLRSSNLNVLQEANLATDPQGRPVVRYTQVKGKKRKTTEVTLNNVALAIIAKYKGKFPTLLPPQSEWECRISLRHALVTAGGFEQLIEEVYIKGSERISEIKPRYEALTFHTSRHTFATYLLNEGMDLTYVQQLLGHASATTTAIYAKADKQKVLAKAHQLLEVPMMVAV